MATALAVFHPLSAPQRNRVLSWLVSRVTEEEPEQPAADDSQVELPFDPSAAADPAI